MHLCALLSNSVPHTLCIDIDPSARTGIWALGLPGRVLVSLLIILERLRFDTRANHGSISLAALR
jgi:hypothetical protein